MPTPVDKNNRPDFTPLYKASETVAKVLKKGDIVVYESTVYPGATEEECVPVLEKNSNLKFNIDFFVGYSPERINPGDKEHTVEKILKITSGSTPEVANIVNSLYQSVITAGTHLAPSIKVAEAAKVIENSQRDVNIAFVEGSLDSKMDEFKNIYASIFESLKERAKRTILEDVKKKVEQMAAEGKTDEEIIKINANPFISKAEIGKLIDNYENVRRAT